MGKRLLIAIQNIAVTILAPIWIIPVTLYILKQDDLLKDAYTGRRSFFEN